MADAMKHISAIFASTGNADKAASALASYINLINPAHVQSLQASMERANEIMREFEGKVITIRPVDGRGNEIKPEVERAGFRKY